MQRPTKVTNEEDKDFVDVSGNSDNGILKKIVKEGDGNMCPEGVVAIVHYTGKLTNGSVFDSSRKRRAPFTFNIGERKGMKIWKYHVGWACVSEAIYFVMNIIYSTSLSNFIFAIKIPHIQSPVILGWDKGVATMQRGEVCILKLAPEYAYGSGSVGPIPPNSTLVFEIELVGWKVKSPTVLGLPIERVGQVLGIFLCLFFAYYKFFLAK